MLSQEPRRALLQRRLQMASDTAVSGVRPVHTLKVMMHSKEMLQMVQIDKNDDMVDKLLVEVEKIKLVQQQQQLTEDMARCSMTVLHHVRMEKLQLKLRMEDNVESNSRALLWMAPWRLKLYDATMRSAMSMKIGGHGALTLLLPPQQSGLRNSQQEESKERSETAEGGQICEVACTGGTGEGVTFCEGGMRWGSSCSSMEGSYCSISEATWFERQLHQQGLVGGHASARAGAAALATDATLHMLCGAAGVMNYMHHLDGIYLSYLDGTYSFEYTPQGGAGVDGGSAGARAGDWMIDVMRCMMR